MKNKQKSKVIAFLMIFVILLLIIIILLMNKTSNSSSTLLNISSREDDFKPLINEYSVIANLYYDDYKKNNSEELIYLVPNKYNDIYTACITDECRHSLELNEEQRIQYNKIKDSYYLDKHHLEYICVYNGFVSFCNNGGRASYVYSVEDKKPEYISSPNSPYDDIAIKKLSEHWYWVCKRK